MTSDNSLKMKMSFGHFFLYDSDLKLNSCTKKEEPSINPEFRYIAGTTSFDFKNPKGNKVKFSEIYNYKIEDDNNNNNNSNNNIQIINSPSKKQSVEISLRLDAIKNVIEVHIAMCKLTISPNFSTIFRAYSFAFKYMEIFNNSINKLKYEQLRENINENIIENNIQDSAAPIVANEQKNEINDINEKDMLKMREKSTISVLFSMEGINLLLPINHDSKNTYIIFMALEMPFNYVLKTDSDLYFHNSKLIKIDYLMKTTQISMSIKEGSFSIYEFQDDFILLNSKNKIIENFTISLLLYNKLNKEMNAYKNDINIFLNEKTEFSINVNQIIIFMDLMDTINEFLKKMNNDDTSKIVLNKKQDIIDDELKMALADTIFEARDYQERLEKRKAKEKKKLDPIDYIDIFNYTIKFSDLYIKFYDIIDGIYQPLFEFSMKETQLDLYQNSNPKDSANLIKYLKSTFLPNDKEQEKFDTYDKNFFYLYFNAITTIEIRSLNNYLNQWECLIEPFKLNFYFCQLLKRMRPNIELYLDNMLNINFSLDIAKIFQFIIKKFSLNKEEIKKMKEFNDENKINTDNIYQPKYIGIEAPALILENYSGVDMDIWFDNILYDENNKDNDLIIRIKNNEKYELSMNLLNKYNVEKKNNNLNSTLSYKFCLEESLINSMNIDKNKLIGNNFNINYHYLKIHDITNIVKVSVESRSDNLLIRHVIFSSLISLKNDTKFKDLEIYNNKQKINLVIKKKETIPISWLLDKNNRSLNLIHEGNTIILLKDMNNINYMNRIAQFKNGIVIMIDIIKYKFDTDEYYINKDNNNINTNNNKIKNKKEDIYRIDLIITSPIYFLNNTPYDFIINNNEKILSTESLSSYPKNAELFLKYRQALNENDKKISILDKI